MNNFLFHNPTKILFGKGMLQQLGSELKTYGSIILFVYGSGSIKKTGLYDKIIKIFLEQNIKVFELPDVKSNPVLSLVQKGVTLIKENRVEAILAVGGGSVIDTAKVVSVGAMVEHNVWDFFLRKEKVRKSLPLVAIPTLPASASEMNGGAVITNEGTNEKLGVWSESLYPRVSILDPELTFSIPANYIAYGAADMLSHILEPYCNGADKNTTIPDSLSEAVIKIIMQTIPKLLMRFDNYDMRGDLMWLATISHNGMISCGASPVWYYLHAIAHSLGALYKIPHGAGISVITIGWTKYTAGHAPAKLAQIGRNVFNLEGDGEETALRAVEKLEEWFKLIKCPVALKELDITEDKFKEIAENVLMNVTRVLKSKDEENLKEFGERYYSEAQGEDIEALLKFEKERVLNILELCK